MQDWKTMKPNSTGAHMYYDLKDPQLNLSRTRHCWIQNNDKLFKFLPTNKTNNIFFPPQMSNGVWEAGKGNWRDMLTVWFWHMGIRAYPAKLSGCGKIYCCWTKALETESGLHIQRSSDSSVFTHIKSSEENEKHRGSLSATCPKQLVQSPDLFRKWTALKQQW